MQDQENAESANIPSEKNKLMLDRYRKFAAIILIFIIGFWVGFEKGKQNQTSSPPQIIPLDQAVIENKESNQEVDFSLYWKVWDLLKEKYVDAEKLDANKLLYGSINGMLQATGDPYTSFLTPEENKRFDEDIEGSFEGIGAELGIKNEILTIVAPLEGAPAEKAGLRSGDKIVKINGKSTTDMTLEGAVNEIRGPKGTNVILTIFREGEDDMRDVSVERNVINVKSVESEIKNDNIAYIKIIRFGEETTKEFTEALKKSLSKNINGLVIDLRNNPGGYLDSSVAIASKMLPGKNVVVIEENSDKSQDKIYAEGGDIASGVKTIILINEGSASASEILAGALKDNRSNVTIIGKKSFGKGSVQELIKLPQGTATKITVARWLTPKGNQINEIGITPDIEAELTVEDYENNRDPQLDKALQVIKENK
ncbi:MAG: hypothetical protein ACD_11C00020G0017 [uncultured bacterium]|nr:MAG: hypothetical protein ACD_11C00020G0017 [uncultured bacterium]HBR71302.1 hypothetical protein [Candidatus Moranbacteria bacterium]